MSEYRPVFMFLTSINVNWGMGLAAWRQSKMLFDQKRYNLNDF